MRKNKKFKKGAASFYIVAFSTLILMILATSFAAVIISEITRTSNDDLSQSAYDSAMAGVEDAKLAFYSYRNCTIEENRSNDECQEIINKIENDPNCDMVQQILKRDTSVVQESNVANNMQQAYTCVKIKKDLYEYASTVSTSNMIDVIQPKFGDGVTASDIGKIRVSWYENEGQATKYATPTDPVTFDDSSSEIPVPPVLFVGLVQTAEQFKFSDFDTSWGNTTDRGMVYLVPSSQKLSGTQSGYTGAWNSDASTNVVSKDGFVKSNSKTAKTGDKPTNQPYLVYCDEGTTAQFICSTELELPEPVNGNRNDDTFTVVVGLPYGKGATDFTVEFLCKDASSCGSHAGGSSEEGVMEGQAVLDGVQIEIDSTGKANDLYRRVQVRLKNEDHSVLSIMGPLELLGDGEPGLKKTYRVGCEQNFTDEPNCG